MSDEKFAKIRSIINQSGKCPFWFSSELYLKRISRHIERAGRLAPKRGKVLDLGCGWGHTTAMLAILRPDLKIQGIDLIARPTWREFEGYGCKFRVEDALDLRIGDEGVDMIISFAVMEEVVDDEKFLAEIKRVLKPGSFNLVYQLPNLYSPSELFSEAFGLPYHKRRYTERRIIQQFKAHGFEILEIGRENLVPAQIGTIHLAFQDLFNKNPALLDKLDRILCSTSLNFFSQSFSVVSKKRG